MGLSKETKEKAQEKIKLPHEWVLKDIAVANGRDVAIFARPNEPDLWLWDEQLEERSDGIYCRKAYVERQNEAAKQRRS